ncbi:MAG: hypothetical protein ACF8NJ_02395 [Phycisphaerales bacterium JB038]
MPIYPRVILGVCFVWAALALAYQVYRAWGGGRRDFSRQQGRPGKGVVYNFTHAMLPANKESVRHHPGKFAIGMGLHVGALAALLNALVLAINADLGVMLLAVVNWLALLGLVMAVALFVRRPLDPNLRAMSSPDDYLAIAATCGLLAVTAIAPHYQAGLVVMLLYASAVFVYMPLGKLRHAVFFFAARANYGRRLGYRGVYPPAPMATE